MNARGRVNGALIVLEGMDGSGTTTQLELVSSSLRAAGHRVVTTREPTTGPVGRFLRSALQGQLTDQEGQAVVLDWSAMALLFAADRVDHVEREIRPALESGAIVLSDRYDLSSLLYQSLTSPLGEGALPWLRAINAQARRPDLTIVLDVHHEVAQARRITRGGPTELYETAELQRLLSLGYGRAQKLMPDDRIVTVMADAAAAIISDEIVRMIEEFILRA